MLLCHLLAAVCVCGCVSSKLQWVGELLIQCRPQSSGPDNQSLMLSTGGPSSLTASLAVSPRLNADLFVADLCGNLTFSMSRWSCWVTCQQGSPCSAVTPCSSSPVRQETLLRANSSFTWVKAGRLEAKEGNLGRLCEVCFQSFWHRSKVDVINVAGQHGGVLEFFFNQSTLSFSSSRPSFAGVSSTFSSLF